MIEIFKSDENGRIAQTDIIEDGVWVRVTNPLPEEMEQLRETLDLEPDFIRAALDEEERAHTEKENSQTLIIVDTPYWDVESSMYTTMPLAILVTAKVFLTISLRELPLLKQFSSDLVKGFFTQYRDRFVLQILYRNAVSFLQSLRTIDKLSNQVEGQLHVSMKNKELIQMLTLEKSLVFFSTSLRSNEMVLEKLLKYHYLTRYPSDQDLLEDVIIENKQAIEMCNIYSSILSGTMDAFASVISNNLNIVMKVLTSITIVMAIPNIVFSFFGMNVQIPGSQSPYSLPLILLATLAICFIVARILKRKDLF